MLFPFKICVHFGMNREWREPTMVGGQSKSQYFNFNIYGISASAISSPLSMAMAFPLADSSSCFVLSRWIISSRLVCCVFLESGCWCLSLESRNICLHLFVINNGGCLEGKWIWKDIYSNTLLWEGHLIENVSGMSISSLLCLPNLIFVFLWYEISLAIC